MRTSFDKHPATSLSRRSCWMELYPALILLTIGLAPAVAAETPLAAGGPRAAIKPLLELTSTCIEVSGVAIIVGRDASSHRGVG
jgi:hypothetical protein